MTFVYHYGIIIPLNVEVYLLKKFICLLLAMLIAFSTFSVTALAAEVADDSWFEELTETSSDVIDRETFENLLTELAEQGFFENLFTAFLKRGFTTPQVLAFIILYFLIGMTSPHIANLFVLMGVVTPSYKREETALVLVMHVPDFLLISEKMIGYTLLL